MKQCRKCKKKLQEGWLVCPFCGVEAQPVCAKCGKELAAEFKVCPYCATPVATAAVQPEEPLIVQSEPAPRPSAEQEYAVGDTLEFGTYEQDALSNGAEPVEWIVLEKVGDILFVVSKKILDCREAKNAKWSENPVRKWLNNDFVTALCKSDPSLKQQIMKKFVNNGTDERTEDTAFLLSYAELEKHFSNEAAKEYRNAEPTEYALSQGDPDVRDWLLRDGPTAQYHSFQPMTIVHTEKGGIRPAICIQVAKTSDPIVEVPEISETVISSKDNLDSDPNQDDPNE